MFRIFSRGVIFTRAGVSLALLSLRKNGGLLNDSFISKTCHVITFDGIDTFDTQLVQGK